MNAAFGDRVGNHTSVVAHIGRFHFGDVEISRLLGHEPPRVLDDKRWVLVEDPCEGEFCGKTGGHKSKTHTVFIQYIIYTHVKIMCASSAVASLQCEWMPSGIKQLVDWTECQPSMIKNTIYN